MKLTQSQELETPFLRGLDNQQLFRFYALNSRDVQYTVVQHIYAERMRDCESLMALGFPLEEYFSAEPLRLRTNEDKAWAVRYLEDRVSNAQLYELYKVTRNHMQERRYSGLEEEAIAFEKGLQLILLEAASVDRFETIKKNTPEFAKIIIRNLSEQWLHIVYSLPNLSRDTR